MVKVDLSTLLFRKNYKHKKPFRNNILRIENFKKQI